jgi:hypothetical protein
VALPRERPLIMPSITRQRIAAGVFLLRFETQYELAATFLRVQEHYESRRFRNRVFSLEQYMDWYAKEFGAFTYYEDWSGFNVPSTALEPFQRGEFDPLSMKEQRLLRLFRDARAPFYVIGIAADADLKHEIAHALYFTRTAYRKAVRAAMREHDTSAMARRLSTMGYHRRVLPDEVHAYLIAPSGKPDTAMRRLAPLQKKLRAIFREHAADVTVR